MSVLELQRTPGLFYALSMVAARVLGATNTMLHFIMPSVLSILFFREYQMGRTLLNPTLIAVFCLWIISIIPLKSAVRILSQFASNGIAQEVYMLVKAYEKDAETFRTAYERYKTLVTCPVNYDNLVKNHLFNAGLPSFQSFAKSLKSDVAAEESEPFQNDYFLWYTLFLRPFCLDGEVERRDPVSLSFKLQNADKIDATEPHIESLEHYIWRSLKHQRILLAIGEKKRRMCGPGVVDVSDDEWLESMTILARNAKEIIFVPFYTPGCVDELNFIKKNGFLNKCIFIMFPSSEGNHQSKWDEVKSMYEAHGLMLPEYRDAGAMFKIDDTGNAYGVSEIDQRSPKNFWETYRGLVQQPFDLP